MNDADGAPVRLGWTKQMALSLLPTDDAARPWLIDGWRADRAIDGPKPDPA